MQQKEEKPSTNWTMLSKKKKNRTGEARLKYKSKSMLQPKQNVITKETRSLKNKK